MKQHQGSPEYVAAWQRFDAAVEECRRIEAKYNLPVWATYIEKNHQGRSVILTIPDEQLPSEYVTAVAEWDAARLARNQLYEHSLQDQKPAYGERVKETTDGK